MSDPQNLLYATIQAAHNFGAVAVAGGALGGLALKQAALRRRLAWPAHPIRP